MKSSSISSFRVAAPALAVVLVLLAGEAGVRLLCLGSEAVLRPWRYLPAGARLSGLLVEHPDPAVRYIMRPSWRGYFKGAPFSTNAFGMRGPETTLAKPAGVFRIAVLGASDVLGEGVADEDVFVRRLQRRLDRVRPDRYELLNLATTGYDISRMLSSYTGRVRPFEPDLVLVCLSYSGFFEPTADMPRPDVLSPPWTDVSYWRDRSYLFTGSRKLVGRLGALTLLGTPIWERRLRNLLDERDPEWIANRRTWVSNADRLGHFVADRASEGVRVALLLFPSAAGRDPDFSAKVRAWSKEAPGRVVFDAIQAIRAHPGWDERVSYFDAHPSARAHAIYAEEFGRRLEEFLAFGR